MKYYLSGPTVGLPEGNIPAFDEAQVRLARAGYSVYNPLAGSENNAALEISTETARNRLTSLLESDAIVVLPGWGRSTGAKAEVLVATHLGLPVYAYHQHRPEALELLPSVNIVTRAELING